MNQGNAAAGPFTVTVRDWGTVRFNSGLAAGQEMTGIYPDACGGDFRGLADSGSEVPESDESNNTREARGAFS